MASIIEGYNYDIFISYRQKDNKGDKWVSRFVELLKTELEATFKEDVTVYFDENPHDRLQETHNVDKSLEGKLKCLIFIPILSQTYCDPNSYAWKREFLPFLRMIEKDRFSKDVKLRSGNVASRILPIRIHDLEEEDVKLYEKETGSVLRAIDFVFKTATGVSKPLKIDEDHPHDNINKTYYSDQINKVGHAIKEIILAMKSDSGQVVEEKIQIFEPKKETSEEEKRINIAKPTTFSKRKLFSGISIIAIVIVVAIYFYPKVFKHYKLANLRASDGRITVAVMPLQNMTNETIWDVWQEGIQDELINALSTAEELNPRQAQIITGLLQSKGHTNYASITPSLARNISQELDANVVVYGTIKGASILRINVNLADSKTGNILKSFPIEGPAKEDSIFIYIDALSKQVINFLIMSKLFEGKPLPKYLSTTSPEAYKYLIKGTEFFKEDDYRTSVTWFKKALEIDSNYFSVLQRISTAYNVQGQYELANKYCLRAYKLRDQLTQFNKLMAEWNYALFFQTPTEEIIALEQLREIDDQFPDTYYLLGIAYDRLREYKKVIPECEKGLELFDKFGIKPYSAIYNYLGNAYFQLGQYDKAKEKYKKGLQVFPDYFTIISSQVILSLAEGDTVAANKLIEKYTSLRRGKVSEATIISSLASNYSQAGILDRAEKYYRQALSLEPDSIPRMNNLAYFLIDRDRNINEGMELIDKALERNPNRFSSLHTKGWGLFKQGKYKEALDLLQTSWDLRKKNARYNHEAFLHLEAAKKAVEGKK
jgi:tetratricopeptide (TPR) repeat protein